MRRPEVIAVIVLTVLLAHAGPTVVAQEPGPAQLPNRDQMIRGLQSFDTELDALESKLQEALRDLKRIRDEVRQALAQLRDATDAQKGDAQQPGTIVANESSAIGTLRSLTTSQAQFQSQAVVDQDGDGTGEFGWLGELAGTDPTRGRAGRAGPKTNASPFIAAILGVKDSAGRSQKRGYYFQLWLPSASGRAVSEPQAVSGAGNATDADSQEVRFACYAWPVERGKTGNRTFFVNQAGDVYQTSPSSIQYSGTGDPPVAEAALDPTGPNPRNLDSGIGLAAAGLRSGDGNAWAPAGN